MGGLWDALRKKGRQVSGDRDRGGESNRGSDGAGAPGVGGGRPMKWRLRQWARIPFPSPLDDSRSVLAVKGPLRRFAPWTAAGRSEGMLFMREKGEVRAVWTGRKGTFRPYWTP